MTDQWVSRLSRAHLPSCKSRLDCERQNGMRLGQGELDFQGSIFTFREFKVLEKLEAKVISYKWPTSLSFSMIRNRVGSSSHTMP